MNRRQKKKAYKKRYGHNPPTKSYIYQAYGVDMQNVADALAEGFRKVFYAAKEAVEIMGKKLADAWEKTKERIQTMTEDEYAEFLEGLEPETRGWAAAIRMGVKKDDTGN